MIKAGIVGEFKRKCLRIEGLLILNAFFCPNNQQGYCYQKTESH